MVFFDLCIPYLEKPGASAPDNRSRRDFRLQTAARVMELGYTAVAYDRLFRGFLSDADRCQIAPFTASAFLDAIPGVSPGVFTSNVALHRDLLGVPRASPFRQYTRITVTVDSAAAASALNSGNRLLRSYDLVAARPVNQMAFDQACRASEVDIISLDFSKKLAFRLKLSMVQAAIKRGVYFELSYNHLLAYSHSRRQTLSDTKRGKQCDVTYAQYSEECDERRKIISNAKMLVDWTRGKNLIISGSASNFKEVRGPHDVANLSTVLLGFPMERAKATVSRNCSSLVAMALRKKDCYFKEAIRIERMIPDEPIDSQGDWFKDWNVWDPISSGGSDLPSLDEMAELFSAATRHKSISQNAIDFTSSINGMAPNAQLFPCHNNHEPDSTKQIPSNEVVQNAKADYFSVENRESMIEKFVQTSEHNDKTEASGKEIRNVKVHKNVDNVSVLMKASSDIEEIVKDPFLFSGNKLSVAQNEASLSDIDSLKEQILEKGVEREHKAEALDSLDINLDENFIGCPSLEVDEFISLSVDCPFKNYPDKMQNQEHLVVPFQASTSHTKVSMVKMEQEMQRDCVVAVESTNVVLTDCSIGSELLGMEDALNSSNTSTGCAIKTQGTTTSAEIYLADVLEDSSDAMKEQYFTPEIETPAKDDVKIEKQEIIQPDTTDRVTHGDHWKLGKHRHKGRPRHPAYLLTFKNACKHMLFKKRSRRLRRAKILLD